MFKVNEIFTSIQGEGFHTGTPSHFIRFQGCPHACPFCDTKMTWVSDGAPIEISTDDLIRHVHAYKQRYPHIWHVVLTGGEPLYGENGKNLSALITGLWRQSRFLCQIETSGTECPPGFERLDAPVFITASPKRPHHNAYYMGLHESLVPMIHELKFLVDGHEDAQSEIEKYLEQYKFRPELEICVQPIDYGDASAADAERTKLAEEQAVLIAENKGWRLSAQMHKFLGIH